MGKMLETVSIHSNGSSGELTFHSPYASERSIEQLEVTLTLPGVKATLTVFGLEIDGPSKFFGEMALHWKGWNGARTWRSLEGELELSATCDKLGHVLLTVQLHENPGSKTQWILNGAIMLEAGQLASLDQEMKSLLGT
ncbi:MAG TPA: DUF6228 family protein [Planctomycetota bacterium]|nr:DUF6228 family protein [Planctomycetota bacterium]